MGDWSQNYYVSFHLIKSCCSISGLQWWDLNLSEYKKFVIKLIIVQSFSAKAFIVYVKSFPCPPFLIIKNIEDELSYFWRRNAKEKEMPLFFWRRNAKEKEMPMRLLKICQFWNAIMKKCWKDISYEMP